MPNTEMLDLMAVAVARRVLLELGLELHPDALELDHEGMGRLEAWVRAPNALLAGLTPMEALEGHDGEAKFRSALERAASGASGTAFSAERQVSHEETAPADRDHTGEGHS